jgi:hypothetical protein
VALVHAIERLLGHQLAEMKVEEADVLKGITRVSFLYCTLRLPWRLMSECFGELNSLNGARICHGHTSRSKLRHRCLLQVYAARRAAMLQIAEGEGVNTKDKRVKRMARQL